MTFRVLILTSVFFNVVCFSPFTSFNILHIVNFQTPNAQVEFSVVADSDYSRYFAIGTNGDLYIQQPLNLNDPKPAKIEVSIHSNF